jgi:hypothetical protein
LRQRPNPIHPDGAPRFVKGKLSHFSLLEAFRLTHCRFQVFHAIQAVPNFAAPVKYTKLLGEELLFHASQCIAGFSGDARGVILIPVREVCHGVV